MLNAFAAEFLANLCHERLTNGAIVGRNPHFDQRMRSECNVDFVENGRGQTFIANHHHGIEVMGSSAQCATCAGGKV